MLSSKNMFTCLTGLITRLRYPVSPNGSCTQQVFDPSEGKVL